MVTLLNAAYNNQTVAGLTKHIINQITVTVLYQSCISHLSNDCIWLGMMHGETHLSPSIFFLVTLKQAKLRMSQKTKQKHL